MSESLGTTPKWFELLRRHSVSGDAVDTVIVKTGITFWMKSGKTFYVGVEAEIRDLGGIYFSCRKHRSYTRPEDGLQTQIYVLQSEIAWIELPL